jgi:hypothetical protein
MAASLPSNAKVRVRASKGLYTCFGAVIGHRIGLGKSCPREVDDALSRIRGKIAREHKKAVRKLFPISCCQFFQGMLCRGFVMSETACEVDQDVDPTINAAVRIEATDRKSWSACYATVPAPIFASERLLWAPPAECRGQGRALHAAPRMQRLIYQLPKQRLDGQTVLSLTPMEF